jgi:hypothetical protein
VIIEFDAIKNERNIRERGLNFEMVKDFDFSTAILEEDTRKNYGEIRMNAVGFIHDRLYAVCFKPIGELHIRVISLRKCNARERKKYEKTL